ncbi:DUF2953 domain-containing protein [Alkaliphilus pronyensis]|uniref:DUF2953 domain-containing protein n=1 Tax=Alkaliphilus pronyensis TaxID=1482732 RepID=A0A6I0F776_9FIRM|nr:DUF2953 domain-containing protein [Alkaliphilus pronyensis]KAB3532536.1 DUF2953 domain-containing protein [Alkaliphilus pronyensis]
MLAYVYFIIIVIMLFLAVITFTNINIRIQFLKKNERKEIVVDIKLLYGLLKYRIEIPLVELISGDRLYSFIELNSKLEVANSDVVKKPSESFFNYNEMKLIYNKAKKIYEKYIVVKKYIFKRIKIVNFNWETELGTDDAAITGFATGLAWVFKANAINYLKRNFFLNDFNINITPAYGIEKLDTSLDCIIKLKIGYIIIVGFKIIIITLKNRGW